MNGIATSKVKFMPNRKVIKVAVISILLLLAASALVMFIVNRVKAKSQTTLTQQAATVRRGDLGITISGSGPAVSSEKSDVTPKTDGTVTKVYFKEGDVVKAGDLMYEMDDAAAKLNVEKIKASIAQAELSQKNTVSNLDKLKVTAPFSGQVTGLSVKQGDTLSNNSVILTLVDQSKLKLTVPFNSSIIKDISVGKKAAVHVQNLMQSVEGTVSYVNNTSFSTATGGQLVNVDIIVNNPGSISEGMKANAEINTSIGVVSSTDNGTFSNNNNQVIRSSNSGVLDKLNVKEGQYVNAGEILAEISNDDLILTKDSGELKLVDLYGQLESAIQELEYYKVYSLIDGTIVKQNIKEGDVVKSAQVMASVTNTALMECSISIDELDIDKIKVGQTAVITADALAETSSQPLRGEVSKIAVEGTSSNGVTTYPVTLRIIDPGRLKSGMNVDIVVSIEDRKNVLYLPIEAVQKVMGRTFVMVKGDGSSVTADGKAQPSDQQGTWSAEGRQGASAGQPNGDAAGARQGARQRTNAGQSSGEAANATQSARQGTNAAQSNGGNAASGSGAATGGASGGNLAASAGAPSPAMLYGRNNPQLAEYYANVVMKPVEVGINNESYIEIVSGLSEGDNVVLPPKTASQNTAIGGMTGGNPMGGVMGGTVRVPAGGNAGGFNR